LKKLCSTNNPAINFTSEAHYHTFILGLIAGVTDTHHVHSNKEYGLGRPDCLLIPKDTQQKKGIILEFKIYIPKKSNVEEDDSYEDEESEESKNLSTLDSMKGDKKGIKKLLQQISDEAITQIEMRGYNSVFDGYSHIKEIIQIGMVFHKRCIGLSEKKDECH